MIKTNKVLLVSTLFILLSNVSCTSKQQDKAVPTSKTMTKKMNVKIVLGSTRQGRTSERIGLVLEQLLAKRADVAVEILDIKDFNLPFLYEETPPASREKITDPAIQKWSEAVASGDAYIMVVPEYNSGYPGVLKNAMDILYKEWNNKPVAFVGYSGGDSGGANAIAQLRTVAKAFKMIPIETEIRIPTSWKAFDKRGGFVNPVEQELNQMIDSLIRR